MRSPLPSCPHHQLERHLQVFLEMSFFLISLTHAQIEYHFPQADPAD
ncbi:MAG: hypothetical protein K0Q87_1000 [Neobacillus sp.]|nr:hypothetical protein [Neobacillus sp.]